MSKQTQASAGIGFGGLLTLVFVAAKLWDRIDWAWGWVFAPLWMPAVAVLGIVAVFGIVVGAVWCVASLVEVIQRRNRRAARARRDAGKR